MGKIVISENVSLDGVVQDPTGEEGFRVGGWFRQLGDGDRDAWIEAKTEEAMGTDALLLGRRSYEWFAQRWADRTGQWADRLNSLPKYVVSSTLDRLDWRNSTVLRGDVVDEVRKLREGVDGDVVVYASGRLVHALMEHDLADELRLVTFPVVLGGGDRLFGATADRRSMRLVDARTIGDGLPSLTYRRDLDAR